MRRRIKDIVVMDDFSDFFRKYDQFLIELERTIYTGRLDIRKDPSKRKIMELLDELMRVVEKEKRLLRIEESMYSIQSMYNITKGVDNGE